MKKIFTYSRFGLLAMIALFTSSCEKEKLADVLSDETFPSVGISVAPKTEVGTGSVFNLTGGELIVPVTVQFSAATSRAFSVQLVANVDTVAGLVTSGALATGTLALENGSFSIPTVMNVPIGVTSATFDLVISRSFLERRYGKSVAFALKLQSPGKGNAISAGKNISLVVIKVGETITADQVHYVSFGASKILSVPTLNNYNIGSLNLTVDIPLFLSSIAGPSFSVDIVQSDSAATAAIAAGLITNAELMPTSRGLVPANSKATFEVNKNTSSIQYVTNFATLMSRTNKKWALGLKLINPTRYQTSLTNKTIVLVIDGNQLTRPFVSSDPNLSRPFTGTPFLIPGTIGKASELIPAAAYDEGGENIAFHDNGGKDGATSFRPNDQVDIGNYIPRTVVGWTGDGEWLTYTINVETAGTYELNSIIGSNGNDGKYKVLIDGVDITGDKPVKGTPGTYGDQQPNYIDVQLPAGRHIFKFFMVKATYDVKGWIFTRKS
ncbi:MAG: hypothetical protein V4687_11840 [Bacteroidota bacterium]